MRKPFSAAFVPFLLLFCIFAMNSSKAAAQRSALTTVPSVDLKRYSGRWYEIARLPNKFQKDCVGNVVANYAIEPDGDINVINRCLKKDGKINEAKGKAKIEDKQTNAKLEVRFA